MLIDLRIFFGKGGLVNQWTMTWNASFNWDGPLEFYSMLRKVLQMDNIWKMGCWFLLDKPWKKKTSET